MRIVTVHTNPAYDVLIGSGVLSGAGGVLSSVVTPCKAALITDSIVDALYADQVENSLAQAGFSTCKYVFPSGEQSKNINTLSDILEFLAQNQLTRSDVLVALGGGVVGDITGFAAGVYLRGVRFMQIPTTLLADVDSSVGGKTAVDLRAGKNLAGVFKQPVCVLIDTDTLSTLSDDVFADGAAEAIKYGVLCDAELFDRFEQAKNRVGLSGDTLETVIERCVAIKAQIVEQDELDNGLRRTLNLGHTVGHGIELLSDYRIPHGHAVAAGMAVMARSCQDCEQPFAPRLEAVLKGYGLPVKSRFDAADLARAALLDKKRAGGSITVVAPREIGRCELVTIPVEDLALWIERGNEQ